MIGDRAHFAQLDNASAIWIRRYICGESADEIFGGYRQFHDPNTQQSDAFPWIAIGDGPFDPTGDILAPALRSVIGLDNYMRDRYTEAVEEVARLDGEDDFTHRMRLMSYLHLTRFVRILLDRKDRMSMAVGLEVRVPYCDHRLVEYVYNTPWSLKSYDGREKSLLRGAVRDVLPESVVKRVKSPYPSRPGSGGPCTTPLRCSPHRILPGRRHSPT